MRKGKLEQVRVVQQHYKRGAMKQAKRYGLTEDNVLDMVLWAVPSCIIGARLYYVIFYLDLYRNADGSLNWGRWWRSGTAA